MCGIAGFTGADRSVIERMTDALVHRGPDGKGIWASEKGCMGHCRLAILDPRPEGNQPMWNEDHSVGIVYNGEIYNFKELRGDLDCKTNTDTEVILKLFERHGMSFIHKLRGMFAIGIYDAKHDTWHLARDANGIKPLFIATIDGQLAFASEMRSLLKAFKTKPELNMTSLSQYMRLQYVPGPYTLCEGIEQLPPGMILNWEKGKETRYRFHPEESQYFEKREHFKEFFPGIMDKVVKQHLISDKPVGIFLSGGMDSSIVLYHMSEHTRGPVKSFTVRFDATEEEDAARFNTDAELAKKTAAVFGTEHRELMLTAEMYRDAYEDTARSLDQPNADSVSVAQFLLSRMAKEHVDVVLTGAGGDELFGGYPRYRIARIIHALRAIPGPLRGAMASALGYPGDVLKLNPGPLLAERLLARPESEGLRIARGDWFDGLATRSVFEDHFDAVKLQPKLNKGGVRPFMEADRHMWLVDESLRLADATTMGSGVEGRVPFVDERVIAAAHATPGHWHVDYRDTKVLLKDTYREILPEHLFTLKKASFYPPLSKWLRREAYPLVERMLEHPRIAELFDVEELRIIAEEHRTKKVYHLHTLSTLIQLSFWFDTVYDAR